MFLPHLNAGNAPAPAPVDFVPGFDDIETAPPVDVMPEREPAPDFVPGFDDMANIVNQSCDDWRTVPGRKISTYNGNVYEFKLSNGTRRIVTVKWSEGMQHARDFLRSCWEPCKTEPIVYVPQPVPVDVDEIEPETDETETDNATLPEFWQRETALQAFARELDEFGEFNEALPAGTFNTIESINTTNVSTRLIVLAK